MRTRHETSSSFVRAVEHDPATNTAIVHLDGGSYRFHSVPESDLKALIGAPSVGTHFNKVFKAKHGGKAVRI